MNSESDFEGGRTWWHSYVCRCIKKTSGIGWLILTILLITWFTMIATFRSCKHAKNEGRTDRYLVVMPDGKARFWVKCNHEMGIGGWTVIQERTAGNISFDKSWDHYKKGFGTFAGNHWLGNDKVNLLTKNHDSELLVYFWTSTGKVNATFSRFYLDSEKDNYRLHYDRYLGGSHGLNLTDNLLQEFSTLDQDHDHSRKNCAKLFGGGWWYGGPRYCSKTFLNSHWDKENVKWISSVNDKIYFGIGTGMMIR